MDGLLTPAGAAKILDVVPATVRQMAISGRLPALKTESGMRLFRRADVERLAAERAGQGARFSGSAAETPAGEGTHDG